MNPETLLAVLVWALYAHDSLLLLARNEALLASPWPRRWLALFASRNLTWRGREACFLAVLVPAMPLFRLAWDLESAPSARAGWEAVAGRLRALQLACVAQGALVLGALPVALLLRAGDRTVLGLLVATYVLTAVAATLVWALRATCQLPVSRCAAWLFEALVCPPLACNLVRKVSLHAGVPEDFASAAARLLPRRPWEQARFEMAQRIDDELLEEEDGTARAGLLRKRKADLQ